MSLRKSFTIEEKAAIIRRLEKGESNSSVAKEFGVGHSTISMININKNKIMESLNSNILKPKRLRKSTQVNVELALFSWFKTQSSKNPEKTINGRMLLDMANYYGTLFDIDYTFTPSWISRFKSRHNIVFHRKTDKSSSVDQNTITKPRVENNPQFEKKVYSNINNDKVENDSSSEFNPHEIIIKEESPDNFLQEETSHIEALQKQHFFDDLTSNIAVSQNPFLEEHPPELASQNKFLEEHPPEPEVSQMQPKTLRKEISKKKKKKISKSDVLQLIVNKLEYGNNKHDAFGRNVAEKLRDLPSEMAIYCERIINDALFQAQIKSLNKYSRIVNRPSFPSD